MGFLFPKVPSPPPPPNPAVNPTAPKLSAQQPMGASSLISSSPAGLARKSGLNKTSLIGGG